MRFPVIRAVLIPLCLATSLGACVHSDLPPIDPMAPTDIRVTMPTPPADVRACFRKRFPDIGDRDLTTGDVVRIIGRAKLLDREKARCGERAQAWIDAVERDFAKP